MPFLSQHAPFFYNLNVKPNGNSKNLINFFRTICLGFIISFEKASDRFDHFPPQSGRSEPFDIPVSLRIEKVHPAEINGQRVDNGSGPIYVQ